MASANRAARRAVKHGRPVVRLGQLENPAPPAPRPATVPHVERAVNGRPPKVVEVAPGYPDIGWREEVARREREIAAHRVAVERLVAQALCAGATYSEVARVLGVSRQAARKRFGHLRPVVVPS